MARVLSISGPQVDCESSLVDTGSPDCMGVLVLRADRSAGLDSSEDGQSRTLEFGFMNR